MRAPSPGAARLSGLVWLTAAAAVVWAGQPVAIRDGAGAAVRSDAVAGVPSNRSLTLAGTRFAVAGQERFLIGVSLFDALGPAPPSDADLDQLAAWGVSLVRVWAHWSQPIYGRDGTLSAAGRERLERLVQRLEARGLLLELVLLRPGQLPGQAYAVFASPEARARAVGEITRALSTRRNVLFDLYNEHDHRDGPISHAEARALRDAVKAADPARLVTLSSTEYHFMTAAGRVSAAGLINLREEVEVAGVDLVAAHLPRTGDWAAGASERVVQLRRALDRTKPGVPLYLSEERRAEAGRADLPAAAYVEAAVGSRAGGAAGWVFHTSAGYSLNRQSFLSALNPEERRALETVASTVSRVR